MTKAIRLYGNSKITSIMNRFWSWKLLFDTLDNQLDICYQVLLKVLHNRAPLELLYLNEQIKLLTEIVFWAIWKKYNKKLFNYFEITVECVQPIINFYILATNLFF